MNCRYYLFHTWRNVDEPIKHTVHFVSFPKHIMEKNYHINALNDFFFCKVNQLCSKFKVVFFSFKSNCYIRMHRSSILFVVVVQVISIMYTQKSMMKFDKLDLNISLLPLNIQCQNLENVTFIVRIEIVYTSPSDNGKK